MDSLEKELIQQLLDEYANEFESQSEGMEFVRQLSIPLSEIDQSEGVRWVRRVPKSVGRNWDVLPTSEKFVIAMLSAEIESLNVLLDDCENVRQTLSGRK